MIPIFFCGYFFQLDDCSRNIIRTRRPSGTERGGESFGETCPICPKGFATTLQQVFQRINVLFILRFSYNLPPTEAYLKLITKIQYKMLRILRGGKVCSL